MGKRIYFLPSANADKHDTKQKKIKLFLQTTEIKKFLNL